MITGSAALAGGDSSLTAFARNDITGCHSEEAQCADEESPAVSATPTRGEALTGRVGVTKN